jgi:hypothetical protein
MSRAGLLSTSANSVPNAGKADVSAFRKWDEAFRTRFGPGNLLDREAMQAKAAPKPLKAVRFISAARMPEKVSETSVDEDDGPDFLYEWRGLPTDIRTASI